MGTSGGAGGPGWAGAAGGVAREIPVVDMYRERVLGTILTACADGRLDPGELAVRSNAAQQAATLADLDVVIQDIPGPGLAAVAGRRRGIRRVLLSVLGLEGRWARRPLAARVTAASVLGDSVIDLRRMPVTSFETELTVVALGGEVRLVVPAGYRVETGRAVTVLGRTAASTPAGRGDALTPVIRLRSVAVLGNVLTSQVPAAA